MVNSWEWVIIIVLLVLSAFFSGSETALVSLNKIHVKHLVEAGVPKAKTLYQLVSRPNRMLSTILIGHTVVNITIASMVTSIVLKILGFHGVAIAAGIATILVLVFGEITPKSIAAVYNEKVALVAAIPIYWLQKILYPVIKVIGMLTNLMVRLFGGSQGAPVKDVTEEEIRVMVDLGEGQGAIKHQEREMIDNVFQLNDTFIHQVMLPRVDIVAVEADSLLQEAWNKVIKFGHSRLPVYAESLDNIVGIIYAKDLMAKYQQLETLTARSIMREALHVPETKRADDLLREMRRDRIHIAVVLDEFGGTAGLVFLEDLVETVVGEIGDEYDVNRPLVKRVKPGEIRVNARVGIDEVNEMTGLDLPEEDFDTIGGLVFHLVGQVPEKGDSIEFEDCILRVEAMNGKRISQVLISVPSPKKDKSR